MQYGYFDDQAKNTCCSRYAPPAGNYQLRSTAVITNNAGGYGFYKSNA
jgi:hypothetical protein